MEFLYQWLEVLEMPVLLAILTYIEKVQFICLAANAIREQQDIALLPGNLLGRKFMTSSRRRHRNGYQVWMRHRS